MRYALRLARTLILANHALMLEYRSEIYLWVISHVLPFIMMGLWGLETAQYFTAVFIVRQFSVVWVIYDFEWQVVEGRLSNHLLKPVNPIWNFVAAHLGEQIARLPFFAAILTLILLAVPQARWQPTLFNTTVGILAIYAAFLLRFAMSYCLCMLTFWYEKASAMDTLLYLPFLFLSGMIAPLSKFPPLVRTITRYTPFPYLIDFPARILTRASTTDPIPLPEIARGFTVVTLYLLLFSTLAAHLWKKGLRHYSGMGA